MTSHDPWNEQSWNLYRKHMAKCVWFGHPDRFVGFLNIPTLWVSMKPVPSLELTGTFWRFPTSRKNKDLDAPFLGWCCILNLIRISTWKSQKPKGCFIFHPSSAPDRASTASPKRRKAASSMAWRGFVGDFFWVWNKTYIGFPYSAISEHEDVSWVKPPPNPWWNQRKQWRSIYLHELIGLYTSRTRGTRGGFFHIKYVTSPGSSSCRLGWLAESGFAMKVPPEMNLANPETS